jgi:hypothetical protein
VSPVQIIDVHGTRGRPESSVGYESAPASSLSYPMEVGQHATLDIRESPAASKRAGRPVAMRDRFILRQFSER